MTDTCTVKTVTGTSVNQTTGVETPTYSTAYTGKCKIQSGALSALNPEAGGATFTVQRSDVHVPVGSLTPAIGQVVTITACALDAGMVGRVFRVTSLLHKSQATAYRLGVDEVV